MGGLLDQRRARIVVLVHAVAEAHEAHPLGLRLHLVDEGLDGLAGIADLMQHPQHGLVRAAVQRPGERPHPRRHRGVQIRLRGADEADRRGRAVLLVIGVEDEEHVEGAHERRIDVVGLIGHAEGHPDEVLGVTARRIRVEQRQARRALGDVGDHRRHLCEQEDERDVELLLVTRIERVLVIGRQTRDARLEDRHRVPAMGEGREEGLEVLMEQAMPLNRTDEGLQGGGVRQLPVDQQVGDLEEGGVLRELLDRVAAIPQDPGVAVDVGDRRPAGGGVGESRVEGDDATLGEEARNAEAIVADRGSAPGQGDRSISDAENAVGKDFRCEHLIGHGNSFTCEGTGALSQGRQGDRRDATRD